LWGNPCLHQSPVHLTVASDIFVSPSPVLLCAREARFRGDSMPRNPPWTREELILALDLYLRAGMLDNHDERVTALSDLPDDVFSALSASEEATTKALLLLYTLTCPPGRGGPCSDRRWAGCLSCDRSW
jgi:hypothetical protein